MSKTKRSKVRVGITTGDINGIGLETILKTFSDSRMIDFCTPVIYGSTKVVNFHKKQLGLSDFHFNSASNADKLNHKKVNLVDCLNGDFTVTLGEPSPIGGKAAFLSLQAATSDLASNKVDVLVTAPIDKHTIQSDEFNFPGHTEYLANYANEDHPLMIMVHNALRVGLVTGHVPVKQVSSELTQDLILKKLEVFHRSLIQDFACSKPKIAVLALNPHAGDNNLIGDEEQTTINPAIKKAREKGMLAFGPFPADGFFGSPNHRKFDGILAMYHDQGLTPFKALSFDEGVNYTAGLPIVRTAPDHGTAYDIAGKNEASERSFRNAVFLACDILRNQQEFKQLTSNVLKSVKQQ